MTDIKPYADDRKWDAEISGIQFFVFHLSAPFVIGYELSRFRFEGPLVHLVYLAITLFFLFGYTISADEVGRKKLGLKDSSRRLKDAIYAYIENHPITHDLKRKDIDIKKFFSELHQSWIVCCSGRWLWVANIALAYVVSAELRSQNSPWTFVLFGFSYFCLMAEAYQESLRQIVISKFDIFIVGLVEPIRDADVFRIDRENIRYRKDGKTVLLNRANMLRIETERS